MNLRASPIATVAFAATAAPVKKFLNGRFVRMLAYNSSVPGPLIKAPQGARITVRLRNQTGIPSSLHPHGLRLENRFDGAPDLQSAVADKDSFDYALSVPDPGPFWYHPHIREAYGLEMGLYGNILVTPRGGCLNRSARSVGSDLGRFPAHEYPFYTLMAPGERDVVENFFSDTAMPIDKRITYHGRELHLDHPRRGDRQVDGALPYRRASRSEHDVPLHRGVKFSGRWGWAARPYQGHSRRPPWLSRMPGWHARPAAPLPGQDSGAGGAGSMRMNCADRIDSMQ